MDIYTVYTLDSIFNALPLSIEETIVANTSKKAARTTPTTKQEKTVVDKVAPIFPAVKTEKPKNFKALIG